MTKDNSIETGLENVSCEDERQIQNRVARNEPCENMKDFNDFTDSCCAGRQMDDDGFILVGGRCIAKEQDRTHYAEILTRNSISPDTKWSSPAAKPSVRRTRKSDNPILRLSDDNSDILNDTENERTPKSTQDDFALYENMRAARNARKFEKELGRKIHVSHSDSDLVCHNTNSEVLYENTHSEIVYQNARDDFNTSHVYENFEDKQRALGTRLSVNSTTSTETSETESFYEDLDVVYEAMSPPTFRPRTVSKPIDIVYSSIDFGRRQDASPVSAGSCTNSSPFGSLERPELRRCTSYCYGNGPLGVGPPPELPQRGSGSFTKRSRPRSCYIGNTEGSQITNFGLGMYTGTLIGSYVISKTSPKSVQKTIGEYLAREKKEHSKPVSFEVTSEYLSLSYNCAPWWLLAKNSVDDIGCITTYNTNNKTALGCTISKPGEDTRLFVIQCSDADQIKEAIVRNFQQPVASNSLARWSSMGVLGTPRSGTSRSLPRMYTSRRSSEIASFDDLVYLGSHKVKKSFLVVNDNISSVLDQRDSKDYTVAKIELYRDAIHLKNSRQDRLLDMHQLEWILSMGLFDEDRRYFGYISSKAFQGSKTRTSCHVFRCNRVGLASQIMETIRRACQATYLARTSDYPTDFRSRTNSNTSTSSEGSISSNSETMSVGSTSSSPPEIERSKTLPGCLRKRPGRFLPKRLSRNRMSTIQSFAEEDNDTGFETLGEENPAKPVPEEKPTTIQIESEKVPQPQEKVSQASRSLPTPPEETPNSEKQPNPISEEKPQTAKCVPEEKQEVKTPKEGLEKRFNVFYLISTIVSPPLKAKHVKECLKQYQKSVDKAIKKCPGNTQHYKKAQLVLSPRGVMMLDGKTQTPQAFYESAIISGVQSHPDGKCAFAFTTLVSGNTKHKCHLFLQDTEPIDAIIKEIQTYILR